LQPILRAYENTCIKNSFGQRLRLFDGSRSILKISPDDEAIFSDHAYGDHFY
jgi:hypothetical protein